VSEVETERDPGSEPRAGDEISCVKGRRAQKSTRQVVYVTVNGTVIYDLVGTPRGQLECSLEAWRRWARHGTVVRYAPVEASQHWTEPVSLDHWLYGQINGLANRCKPERCSTPFAETLLALLELGVQRAVLTLDGERELREILARRLPKRPT